MTEMDEARELYNRYAVNWDEDRPNEVAACFTPDASFITQQGRVVGREAIIGIVRALNQSVAGCRQFHITTNVSVKLNGDYGTGGAYFIYCVAAKGQTETVAYGTYRDELRKVAGHWYFSSRTAMVEAGGVPRAASMPR
jgi:uncharacterized protein (TIGR02246 family)